MVGRKANNSLVATPVLAKGHSCAPRLENDDPGPPAVALTPLTHPLPTAHRRDQELF